MEQDLDTNGDLPRGEEGPGTTKKPRNRSKSRRKTANPATSDIPCPDIPSLLAGLQPREPNTDVLDKNKKNKPSYSKSQGKENAPSNIPGEEPQPESNVEEGEIEEDNSTETDEGRNKNSKATRTSKPTPGRTGSAAANTRTSARTTGRTFPSQNRRWTAADADNETIYDQRQTSSGGSATGSGSRNTTTGSGGPQDQRQHQPEKGEKSKHQQERQLASGHGYSGFDRQQPSSSNSYAMQTKPSKKEDVCLDVTSHRFVPDDCKRIALLLRKMRGDEIVATDGNMSGSHINHNLPTVASNDVTGIPLAEAPGADAEDTDERRFITIADFAAVELPDTSVFHTITRRDTTTFMVVYRPLSARGKMSWEFPPMSISQDFINDMLSKMFADDFDQVAVYIRSGKWGKLSTIVLSTKSLDGLAGFRRHMSLCSYKGYSFDTYPRDVLIAKADVSILLRSSMKTFVTEIIPKVLFMRNDNLLAGKLRVLSTRFYTAADISHKGDSKEHWRSIDLKGDDQFMRCLRTIPESKPFLLGYDAVQIRGGLRPDEHFAPIAGNKRPWSEIQPISATPLLTDPRRFTPGPVPSSALESSPYSPGPNRRGQRGRGRAGRGTRRGRGRFAAKE